MHATPEIRDCLEPRQARGPRGTPAEQTLVITRLVRRTPRTAPTFGGIILTLMVFETMASSPGGTGRPGSEP